MREGGFPAAGDGLDEGGLRKALDTRGKLERYDLAVSSPAVAARETAEALGVAVTVDDRLRDICFGEWAGMSFEQAHARDAAAFGHWLESPQDAVPGGENMADVRERVGEWLSAQASDSQRILAITHPMIVRAALSVCLELPIAATMRCDIAPLSMTILSRHREWRLQALGR